MRYVMGVDGGGSKTVCLVADTQGRLLGIGRGGPVNTNFVVREKVLETLIHTIQDALVQAGFHSDQIDCLCISAPAEPGTVTEAMDATGIQHVVRAAEGETSRWAACFWINEPVGVTVDAGTGSLARGWSRDGRVASAGGWGSTLGDEGSAFWISIQAMRAVLQAHDGRIEPTILTQSVLDYFGVSDILDLVFLATQGMVIPEDRHYIGVAPDYGEIDQQVEKEADGYLFRKIDRTRSLSRDEIASLCPIVYKSAQQGDQKALLIFREAGEELGQLGAAVIRRLGMEKEKFAVVPFGGVFRAGDLVLRSFKETILSAAKRAKVITPRFEPVVGAVLLALNELGVDINSDLLELLDETSLEYPDCRITQERA